MGDTSRMGRRWKMTERNALYLTATSKYETDIKIRIRDRAYELTVVRYAFWSQASWRHRIQTDKYNFPRAPSACP
jgi:hypothetical protein